MLHYAFVFKIIKTKEKNLVNNCTYNVQLHYVKITLYFFLPKKMLDTFHIAGMLVPAR